MQGFEATPLPNFPTPLFATHLFCGRKQGTFMFMENNVKGCRGPEGKIRGKGG